jgi:hypothetical protein
MFSSVSLHTSIFSVQDHVFEKRFVGFSSLLKGSMAQKVLKYLCYRLRVKSAKVRERTAERISELGVGI